LAAAAATPATSPVSLALLALLLPAGLRGKGCAVGWNPCEGGERGGVTGSMGERGLQKRGVADGVAKSGYEGGVVGAVRDPVGAIIGLVAEAQNGLGGGFSLGCSGPERVVMPDPANVVLVGGGVVVEQKSL